MWSGLRVPTAIRPLVALGRPDAANLRAGSNWRNLGSPALALRELLEPRGSQALKLRPSASLFGLDSHPAHHSFIAVHLCKSSHISLSVSMMLISAAGHSCCDLLSVYERARSFACWAAWPWRWRRRDRARHGSRRRAPATTCLPTLCSAPTPRLRHPFWPATACPRPPASAGPETNPCLPCAARGAHRSRPAPLPRHLWRPESPGIRKGRPVR